MEYVSYFTLKMTRLPTLQVNNISKVKKEHHDDGKCKDSPL